MRRTLVALTVALSLLATSQIQAGPRVEADPNKRYEVTPDVGPWMILASHFTGPPGQQLAQELILEIRTNFNQPAYLFVFGEKEHEEQLQRVKEMRALLGDTQGSRMLGVRAELQYGVLVGGYKDMDTARKALNDIKKLTPSNTKFCPLISVVTRDVGEKKGLKVEEGYDNPFTKSFVVHNPSMKVEKARTGPDPALIRKLNADETYNLLKCGKPWTLAVKEIHGGSVLQPRGASSSFLDNLGLGKSQDALSASAMQAHALAQVLREMKDKDKVSLKLDAYVLHGPSSSVVTIGAFDSKDDQKLIEKKRLLLSLKWGGADLGLFSNPMPMEVPQ